MFQARLQDVKVSKTPQPLENLQIAGHTMETTLAANKCLGVGGNQIYQLQNL